MYYKGAPKMIITPPSGTKDFGAQDCRIRRKIFDKLINVAETFAFQPLETPAIERIETMQGKYGEEGEKLFFKIIKRGEQVNSGECDLALRYDLTVPAMRYYIANRGKLPKIFKRFQYGPVWRAERPGKDRYRQFYQFDFDIYGSTSLSADVECLNVIISCLKAIGLNNFFIRLNSRKLLYALMNEFNIPENLFQEIITLIDKVDKIGVEGLRENLLNYKDIGKIKELSEIFLKQNYNDIFLNLLRLKKENFESIDELLEIIRISKSFLRSDQIKIDMTLARGIDYYSGSIFEIEIPGIKGSIAAGGRYNNLSKLFIDEEVSVCGASLGIERIIPLIDSNSLELINSVHVYISYSDNDFASVVKLANDIRSLGLTVESQRGSSGKFRKELSYANQINAVYFIFQGDEERQLNQFFLKDMKENKIEGKFTYNEVIEMLKKF
jgi:histidyl-tRNA synthetase